MNREALKVFLEFLEPFSSEKVFKPPEALAAKPRTPREALYIAQSMQLVHLRILSISCLREIDKNAEEVGRSPNSNAKGF